MGTNKEKKNRSIRNIEIFAELYDFAYQIKIVQLKKKYPNLNSSEIAILVNKSIEKGCK